MDNGVFARTAETTVSSAPPRFFHFCTIAKE